MYKRLLVAICLLCLILPAVVSMPITADAKGYVVVVIDAGHGGDGSQDETESGAIYDTIGKKEKDINLITAQALYDELDTYHNVQVYMTRDDDSHMSIKERLDFAKKKRADVFISCHYNASETHRFQGMELYTSAYDEYYAYGKSLAGYIEDEWKDQGLFIKGAKTRLGKEGDYYGVIRIGREYKIPALILEHGYLDNEADASVIGNEEKWKAMGVADATAIAKFYGLSKDEKFKSVEPEITVEEVEEAAPDTSAPYAPKLTITDYDMNTGEVKYTITADEPESKLYLYGMDTEEALADKDTSFMNLSTWDAGKDTMSGIFMVEPGYTGNVAVRVYNTYELYTDTPLVKLLSAENIVGLEVEEAIAEPEEDQVKDAKINREEKPLNYRLSVIGAVLALGLLICTVLIIKDRRNNKI